MVIRRTVVSVMVVMILAMNCAVAWSQSTAQISGRVTDQSGAVMPGVEVTVTQTATGATRSAVSDETGSYALPNLPIGPYRLEAVLPGFRTYVQTGIVLQVNTNPIVNAVLQVGQIAETVEVRADAALVETRSSGVATMIDNQRVLEIPLNGRNVTELIFLSGMATVNTGTGSMNSVRNYPTVVFNVAGGIANGTLYLLDGAIHNDVENNLNLPLPFPDAMQEFKVETSALPAQYGIHSAAAVNAVTKSGTNQYHGSLFEFVRNGRLNARNAFAPSRDTLKRNQFGGTVGGPIVKSKLLFFAAYQGTTERSAPTQNIAYVPTPAMLAGDFTDIASAACNGGRQITLRAPFVNNRVSTSQFDPAALKISTRLPSTSDPCGKVNFGLRSNQDEKVLVTRLDYTQSNKHSLFGRLLLAKLTTPSTYDGQSLLTSFRNATDNQVSALTLGSTYLLGTGTVNSFNASVTRTRIEKAEDNVGTWAQLGVKATSHAQPVPNLTVNAGWSTGGGNNIVSKANTGPNVAFSDDISILKTSHQIAFGGMYRFWLNNYHSGVQANGSMTFNGQTTNLGLADFLLGKASSWQQGNVSTYWNRQNYIGFYVQDSWKLTPRVTMNYGVRWEPYLAIYSKHDRFVHYDQALADQGVRSKVYVNAPAGVIFPGDSQYECGRSVHCNKWALFAPRLGLGWDVQGDGRTSVRAAYGMFYDRQQTIALTGFGQNVPFGNTVPLTNVTLSDPWGTYPGGDPFTKGELPVYREMSFPLAGRYVTHPFHLKPTAVHQWNLSLQRQIGTDWMASANYVGSTTTHLQSGTELNPAVFLGLGPCTINGVSYSTCSTTANTQERRLFTLKNPNEGKFFSLVSQLDDGGTASYNGLFMQVQKRLNKGISVLSNYTWSHCIADHWNAFVGGSGGSNGYNPNGRRGERGNCNSDTRNVFNTSLVLQTPAFSNRALQWIAGGWQLSPILKMRSGQPFIVVTGFDDALNGNDTANQRPNQVLANGYAANKSVDGWLNRDAFARPAPGTIGNMGKWNMVGPSVFQLDLAVSRTFQVSEGKSVQLRGEAFNLPNHLNPANPISSLNNANFGKIQSDISGTSGLSPGNQRIIQLALKFVF
jgi:hypothetical protein